LSLYGAPICISGWAFCRMPARIRNGRGFPGCVLSILHRLTHMVISPKDKTLETYLFDGSVIHFRTYASTEKAAVGIFPDLTVDLEAVFAE